MARLKDMAVSSGQQKAIDAAGTLLDKIKGELAWT
jgi:hypothetical protein